MKSRDEVFDEITGKEGGYVNHPDDKGGPTKWGITEKSCPRTRSSGDMRDLTRGRRWKSSRRITGTGHVLTRCLTLSPDIAAELCDTGVNMGQSVASKNASAMAECLQSGRETVSGYGCRRVYRPRTINALRAFLEKRGKDGELVMLTALNCTQGNRYLELAEKREANESFVYGWIKERVVT